MLMISGDGIKPFMDVDIPLVSSIDINWTSSFENTWNRNIDSIGLFLTLSNKNGIKSRFNCFTFNLTDTYETLVFYQGFLSEYSYTKNFKRQEIFNKWILYRGNNL